MKKPLHYTICGLDYVYLQNGFEIAETAYGPAVRVLNATRLDRVIARFVVQRQSRMSGQEVRFLRGFLDLSQAELARALGKDAEVVAGWDEGTAGMPLASDLAIPRLYWERTGQTGRLPSNIGEVAGREERIEELKFKFERGRWLAVP